MVFKSQYLRGVSPSGGRVKVTEDVALSAPGARVYRYELTEPADDVTRAFEELQKATDSSA